jgi:hypothetical protein
MNRSMPMNITPRLPSSRTPSATPVDAPLTAIGDEPAPRAWPRCEPASTHFELGASADARAGAQTANRYRPNYGVPKDQEPL